MSDNKYVVDVEEDDDVMTIEEFNEACESGCLIDCDGFGYPAKDGKHSRDQIQPSTRHTIPEDATHVVWYNK